MIQANEKFAARFEGKRQGSLSIAISSSPSRNNGAREPSPKRAKCPQTGSVPPVFFAFFARSAAPGRAILSGLSRSLFRCDITLSGLDLPLLADPQAAGRRRRGAAHSGESGRITMTKEMMDATDALDRGKRRAKRGQEVAAASAAAPAPPKKKRKAEKKEQGLETIWICTECREAGTC